MDSLTVFELKLKFAMAHPKCQFYDEFLERILLSNLLEFFQKNLPKKIEDIR